MKNVINEVTIKLLGKSCNESFARSAVSFFVMQLDPNIDELNDIKTAVSEAVTNSIVHGYRNTLGLITINVKITDDNCVHIIVKDKGCGIENISRAREPMFTTGDSDRSGMDLPLWKALWTSLPYLQSPERALL